MAAVSVIAVFRPRPEQEKQVEIILREMVGPTRKEPGCLRYDLYALSAEQGFVLLEAYADQKALDAHRETEHYKGYRRRIPDLLKEPIKVLVLQPIDAER